MDSDMRKALHADKYPTIEYVFHNIEQAAVQVNTHSHDARFKLRVDGKLNMAGVGRQIAMDVFVMRNSERHFLVHAETTLLMSDFGVTPPVALFGLIKAGNQVRVIFDLDLVMPTIRTN